MAPKKPKLAPAKPAASQPSTVFVRVPKELWDEMCISTARYAYVREQHPQPGRFDAAVDDGIRKVAEEARIGASLALESPKPYIQ